MGIFATRLHPNCIGMIRKGKSTNATQPIKKYALCQESTK